MAKARLPRIFNIPEEMMKAADAFGFNAMATGGGVDYIYVELGVNQDDSKRYVLLAKLDGHGSPTALNKPAELIITLNEDWTDTEGVPMMTAHHAMAAMRKWRSRTSNLPTGRLEGL